MFTLANSNKTHVTVMHKREKIDQNLSKTQYFLGFLADQYHF